MRGRFGFIKKVKSPITWKIKKLDPPLKVHSQMTSAGHFSPRDTLYIIG